MKKRYLGVNNIVVIPWFFKGILLKKIRVAFQLFMKKYIELSK